MYRGSLVTIDDLSNGQIEDILDLAQEIQNDQGSFYGLASKRIMASLFLEPSTRTRGSFESAMKRLGGDTITTADSESSSIPKGESLADTVRIWGGYVDLIAIRHPWEGAARLAAEYSDVPVINAGDGSHEHPTQTLLDLYTLRKELGGLQGRMIVICGDLKHGRTVHSLVYALLRFGTGIIFAPGEDLELPDHVLHKIRDEFDTPVQRVHLPGIEALYGESGGDGAAAVDAIYMTPSRPHNLTFFEEVRLRISKEESLALYFTRRQVEREANGEAKTGKKYPHVDAQILGKAGFSNAVILHPLPRVDELSPALDSDRRSKYFDQARNGVPVRMALIALMLGLRPWKHRPQEEGPPKTGIAVPNPEGIKCTNGTCVTQQEPGSGYPHFTFYRVPKPRFVCSYCDREALPAFYRYPWGELYHPVEEPSLRPLDPSRFGFYLDEASARASGLRPPKRLPPQKTKPQSS